MPTNILFLYNNLFDSATITASSADSDYPASNLQDTFRTSQWKTAGDPAGTANLVINHGSAKPVTACCLIDHDDWAVVPGTFDLEFHTADSWGSPDSTEDLTAKFAVTPDSNLNPTTIIKIFTSISKQYNRLNIVNAAGDWTLGRIFLGTYFSPTRNFSPSGRPVPYDASVISISPGGEIHADEKTVFRTYDISFRVATYAQWQAFQLFFNTVKYSKSFFVAFNYDSYAAEMTWYAKIMKDSFNITSITSTVFEITMTIKEEI